MKKVQQGFTLIELMIVIAIIGILAAVALPSFQAYLIKTRVTTALNTAEGVKTNMTADMMEFNNIVGDGTNTWTAVYGPELTAAATNGEFTTTATVADATGIITITLDNLPALGNAASSNLVLTPTLTNGNVIWACSSSLAAADYELLPGECRNP